MPPDAPAELAAPSVPPTLVRIYRDDRIDGLELRIRGRTLDCYQRSTLGSSLWSDHLKRVEIPGEGPLSAAEAEDAAIEWFESAVRMYRQAASGERELAQAEAARAAA